MKLEIDRHVIHYHGTPIWGSKSEVLKVAVKKTGAFVSYARPDQIDYCFRYAKSVAIDNGAFSAWKRNLEIDWLDFYSWLDQYYSHEKLQFFIIPDCIDGNEEINDLLIRQVPEKFRIKAVPCWHLHESLERLIRLASNFKKIALGSSGDYAVIRSKKWTKRMNEAFCMLKENKLEPDIHGLRMLDGRVLGKYPFHSADSTNLACNVPKFKMKYTNIGAHILSRKPFTQDDKNELLIHRCAVLKGAIEKVEPPTFKQYFNKEYGYET